MSVRADDRAAVEAATVIAATAGAAAGDSRTAISDGATDGRPTCRH